MKRKYSLKKLVVLFWSMLCVLFFFLFFAYAQNVLNIYRTEYIEESQSFAEKYSESLANEIDSMKSKVNNIYVNDSNYEKLLWGTLSEFDAYGTLYLLQQNALSTYNYASSCMTALFYYDAELNSIRLKWNEYAASGSENTFRIGFKEYLSENLTWNQHEYYYSMDGELFYVYTVGSKEKYVGGIIALNHIFLTADDITLALVDNNDTVFVVHNAENLASEATMGLEDLLDMLDGYILTESTVIASSLQLLLIRQTSNTIQIILQSNLWFFFLAIPCIFILMFFLSLRIFDRVLFQPVKYLTSRLNEMNESGTAVKELNIAELYNINLKTDELLTNIIELKERQYNEQRRADRAQLQYYQLQVRPHFFLSCMNMINSLLENDRIDAAKDLILSLSSYYRYVFRDQSSFVRVQEEIDTAHRYCNIFSLKNGMPILLNVSVEEALQDERIPLFTIQTFVENAIKHVSKNGTPLMIRVQVKRLADGELYIQICDNGEGYPDEILSVLNQPVETYRYQESRIGIDNLKYRLRLLYGDHHRIQFSNAPLSGAVVEITLGEALYLYEHSDH